MPSVENVSISQVQPISAPASVLITFDVHGLLPEVIEVYARAVSDQQAILESSVVLTPPGRQYSVIIRLTAGTAFFIRLCPRTATNGVLDPEIDGQDWQTFCTAEKQFTTQAPPPPPSKPKPAAPRISAIRPHQATIKDAGNIEIYWTEPTQVDLFHFMWQAKQWPGENPGWGEIEIDSGGHGTVSPAFPGIIYAFKVQGCISRLIGLDDCSEFSAAAEFIMPPNTRSLREFLQLSSAQLNPGIRSLGVVVYGSGIRAMMHL
jgi:hypothetical protein